MLFKKENHTQEPTTCFRVSRSFKIDRSIEREVGEDFLELLVDGAGLFEIGDLNEKEDEEKPAKRLESNLSIGPSVDTSCFNTNQKSTKRKRAHQQGDSISARAEQREKRGFFVDISKYT